MPDLPDPPDDAPRGRDEESVFARDENDEVVRREAATREQFRQAVTVTIDGYPVVVPKAVPATDARGNERRAADGRPVPRNSTVYDAAAQLVRDGRWAEADLRDRLPVLCHQPHLDPVGVCRMCVVQIQQVKRGEVRTERKLLPACQHPAADNMVVTTRGAKAADYPPPRLPADATAEQKAKAEKDHADMLKQVERFVQTIRKSTGVLAELLLADHGRPATPGAPAKRYEDELETVARVVGVVDPRPRLARRPRLPDGRPVSRNALHATDPAGRAELGLAVEAKARRVPLAMAAPDARDEGAAVDPAFPYSSRTVAVDHDRCILCDRCVRSCSDVKPFKVIGHTGKGYTTRVSFDLDRLMGESSCVQCGECMTACPTGALSLRRRVRPRAWPDAPAVPLDPAAGLPPGAGFLSADEMEAVELHYRDPLTGAAASIRPFAGIPYTYRKWNEGAVRRRTAGPGEYVTLCRVGDFGATAFFLEAGTFHIWRQADDPPKTGWLARLLGRPGARPRLVDPEVRTPADLVLGEMACLTARPRNRTIDVTGPASWVEVSRNMLDMIQRVPDARRLLDRVYTPRAIRTCFEDTELFARDAVSKDEREAAPAFLGAVNNPAPWVAGLADAEVDRLWAALLLDHRLGGGPMTGLGYDAREVVADAVARLAAAAPADFGLAPDATPDDVRKFADTFRDRGSGVRAAGLPAGPAAAVARALAGDEAFGRWFPGAADDGPQPKQLLEFLLGPPGPTRPRPGPPPGLGRPALELLLRLNPVQLRRVEAGQAVVRQDDRASDFYLIRLGFVKVEVATAGVPVAVAHRGPREVFGEAALLNAHPDVGGTGGGRRTASVVALDPVEVVRVRGPVFHLLCALVPAVEAALVGRVRGRAAEPTGPASEDARRRARDAQEPEFVRLGLYQAQKVLALDLLSCTRCDECTRACADSHDGHARLLREGLRFGDFLVATSCRSCHTPYCMDGCPVDAIHRKGDRLEVVIEDHCIGCGLCERNCPYGSIHMVPRGEPNPAATAFVGGHPGLVAAPRRAVNCDLCGSVGGDPFCVAACPHDAAFRLDGPALLDWVAAREVEPGAGQPGGEARR